MIMVSMMLYGFCAKMACIPQCVVILIWRITKNNDKPLNSGCFNFEKHPYRRVNPLDVTCQVGELVTLICPDYPLCQLRIPCVFC